MTSLFPLLWIESSLSGKGFSIGFLASASPVLLVDFAAESGVLGIPEK
jgi:hypothetical protein